jgi:hypothetical protein
MLRVGSDMCICVFFCRFSFVEHNSGYGYFSTLLSRSYPNATVISLERDDDKVLYHYEMLQSLNVTNNAVCLKESEDSVIFRHLYESPELFRFQMISRGLLEYFTTVSSMSEWGETMGRMMSTALTSFIAAPSAEQVSLAMHVIFGGVAGSGNLRDSSGPYRSLSETFGALPHTATSISRKAESSSDLLDGAHLHDRKERNSIAAHPLPEYVDFEAKWLLGHTLIKSGDTKVSLSPIYHVHRSSDGQRQSRRIPLVRSDIMNMTRHVHHHYDYAKDGHTRTYTMRVEINETITAQTIESLGPSLTSLDLSAPESVQEPNGVVLFSPARDPSSPRISYNVLGADEGHLLPPGAHPNQHKIVTVHLLRDRDGFPIPYTSIYGITLISTLRLGLISKQRNRMFGSFLKLPLYEDMAPWNIVLMGPVRAQIIPMPLYDCLILLHMVMVVPNVVLDSYSYQTLDYIDYDTREVVFDGDIPKAYQVMTVLMNYKRSVEDFKRCGSKASTVYGLPYVSDCVGSSNKA